MSIYMHMSTFIIKLIDVLIIIIKCEILSDLSVWLYIMEYHMRKKWLYICSLPSSVIDMDVRIFSDNFCKLALVYWFNLFDSPSLVYFIGCHVSPFMAPQLMGVYMSLSNNRLLFIPTSTVPSGLFRYRSLPHHFALIISWPFPFGVRYNCITKHAKFNILYYLTALPVSALYITSCITVHHYSISC